MLKKDTPMKRLGSQFKVLRDNLPSEIKVLELNAAAKKSIPWVFRTYSNRDRYETKGVKSDFIRIYSCPASNVSVAFTFMFKGDGAVVFASKKVKDIVTEKHDFIFSLPFEFEIFKDQLNAFIKAIIDLKNGDKSYNHDDFFDAFCTQFLSNTHEMTDFYQKVRDSRRALKEKNNDRINEYSAKSENLIVSIKQKRKAVDAYTKNLPQTAEIALLQEKISKLKADISKATDAYIAEIGLNDDLYQQANLKVEKELGDKKFNEQLRLLEINIPSE